MDVVRGHACIGVVEHQADFIDRRAPMFVQPCRHRMAAGMEHEVGRRTVPNQHVRKALRRSPVDGWEHSVVGVGQPGKNPHRQRGEGRLVHPFLVPLRRFRQGVGSGPYAGRKIGPDFPP